MPLYTSRTESLEAFTVVSAKCETDARNDGDMRLKEIRKCKRCHMAMCLRDNINFIILRGNLQKINPKNIAMANFKAFLFRLLRCILATVD